MAEVIRVENIIKIYRMGDVEVRALDGISVSVDHGEFLAVMGASGSGKSTFMNIIGCLDRPSSGLYFLDGRDVSALSRDERADIRNEKIGFVFQSFNLLPRTSALENAELPLLYARNPPGAQARQERARQCLAMVGLSGREEHFPNQLSGGQQQRVAIARSIINDPAIILADEPTGNLDSRTSEEVMAVFQALNDLGKTIIVITHEGDIARFAKRAVHFKDGRLLSDEAVEGRRLLRAAASPAGVAASGAGA
jgi:putative ABC transport system ATP-binding protein